MKKYGIRAVHEQDLRELLEDLELSSILESGELKCAMCGCIITYDNLLCLYPEKEDIRVCCKKRDCYEKLLKRRD